VDLKSPQVQSVRFVYAGAAPPQKTTASNTNQTRPAQNVDDEFRIILANKESFIFRASKLMMTMQKKNPSVEKWECEIRRFTKNVSVGI
jgi:hypothetical protein